MASKRNVLHVINWLTRGGIEVSLLRLLPRIRELGTNASICCLQGPRELDDAFLAMGFSIFRIQKTFNPLSTAQQISRLLSQHPHDIVHSHLGYTSGGIALGANRAHVPVIVSFHNATATALYAWDQMVVKRQIKQVWLRVHRRLMFSHTSLFVGHSIANLDAFMPHWRRANSNRYLTHYLGVDSQESSWPKASFRNSIGVPLGAPLVLHVGSFKKEKNHAGLLAIFQQVLARIPTARLLLVGDGPIKNDIKNLAARLGLSNSVTFADSTDNVWPFYHSANLLLFPSEMEGFGLVVLEAQLARIPVVASDIAAHRESVFPGYHPFLFNPQDHRAAVEYTCYMLTASSDRLRPLVDGAFKYVSANFSLQSSAEHLHQIYCRYPINRHLRGKYLDPPQA